MSESAALETGIGSGHWEKMEFRILLEPRQQDRVRDRIVKTKTGRAYSQKYKSTKQQLYERQLAAFICEQSPDGPLKGPIILDIQSYIEVPSSKTKKFHAAADRGEEWPTGKPDASNLLKNLEDIGNKILWVDDAQIVDVRIRKSYGSPARWQLTVWYRKDRQ